MMNAYFGSDIDHLKLKGGEEFKFNMYGHSMHNPYFSKTMSSILRDNQIDRFIILLDTFMLYPWFLQTDTAPAKTFFWFPTDGGGGLPKGCDAILSKIDQPVAMAQFGQKQVKDWHGLDVAHIPHGVDTKSFYPIPEEDRKILRQKNGLDDKFVIGVVARNQPRKNLDRTIKAMRIIADQIPNAVLFLHLDPNDPAQSMFNINELVKKLGLENRVVYSGVNAFKGFPQNKMNDLYSVMDCFLLTTSGEGFGVPIIEAMSAGVPVIATNYTTTPELILKHKAGLGIELSGVEDVDEIKNHREYDMHALNGTMTGSWEVERGICSITDCAKKVKMLYDDPELRSEMGDNGRKAVLKYYDFKIVGKQWDRMLS